MKEHIKILDFLRGIAALAVVLFHFGSSVLYTVRDNYFSPILEYGTYGVQVFFVISGFVIPFSMYNSNYKITHYFKSLTKRIVRINPPYYVAILLSFVLYYSAILIVNRPIEGMNWPGTSFLAILGNLTFTSTFLKTGWYNPVFWTLALEFQFYILIGLLLPLIVRLNKIIVVILITLLLTLNFFGIPFFFSVASFFVFGIILFLNKEKIFNRNLILLLSIITAVCCYLQNELAPFLFGIGTFLVVLSGINISFKATTFLGRISYSLYITHWAIGLMFEIVLKRILPIHQYEMGKILMILIYTAIAIAFATLFYNYVEKPFIRYSKKIKMDNESIKTFS